MLVAGSSLPQLRRLFCVPRLRLRLCGKQTGYRKVTFGGLARGRSRKGRGNAAA